MKLIGYEYLTALFRQILFSTSRYNRWKFVKKFHRSSVCKSLLKCCSGKCLAVCIIQFMNMDSYAQLIAPSVRLMQITNSPFPSTTYPSFVGGSIG